MIEGIVLLMLSILFAIAVHDEIFGTHLSEKIFKEK
jgi:hypothetical protein